MLFGRGRLSPALEGGPFSPRAVVSDRSNLDDQPPERKERTVMICRLRRRQIRWVPGAQRPPDGPCERTVGRQVSLSRQLVAVLFEPRETVARENFHS